MARPASGRELLAKAKEMLTKAKSVEELRQAQALILPLEYGFSITQVAAVIGTSRGWACQLRMRFIRNAEKPELLAPKRGGRRREHMSIEEEKAFLAPFLDKAASGILVVGDVHNALEQHLGHKVALASAYNLLHRHNWRKLAPDKRNVKADIPVQEDWKKNSPPTLRKLKKSGTGPAHSG
jgi:transposase